jgi:hypothetical protein
MEGAVWHRHHLLAIRLLNFTVLTLLIAAIPRSWERMWGGSWVHRGFSYIGRHSLQVFCWSVFVTMLAYATGWQSLTRTQLAAEAALLAGSLFVPAWLHERYRQWRRFHKAADRTCLLHAGIAKASPLRP